MAGIKIELDDQDALSALQALFTRIQDPQGALSEIGENLKRTTRERFRTQQDPDGNAWEALSPDYLKRKKRNKDKVLTRGGYLQGQLVLQHYDDGLELGSNLVYAATHQFGRMEKNIPARPFLGVSSDDQETILDIVSSYLAVS